MTPPIPGPLVGPGIGAERRTGNERRLLDRRAAQALVRLQAPRPRQLYGLSGNGDRPTNAVTTTSTPTGSPPGHSGRRFT